MKINDINLGGQLYKVGWFIKIHYTRYWMVWLKGIKVIEFVRKYFDSEGYYFNRGGYEDRPETYVV